MKRRLSVTNLSSENNLPMFRLNAPVVIRAKVYDLHGVIGHMTVDKSLDRHGVIGHSRVVRVSWACISTA